MQMQEGTKKRIFFFKITAWEQRNIAFPKW